MPNYGVKLCVTMARENDHQRRASFLRTGVALAVAASTVSTDLAAFVGRPDLIRLASFVLAALLAGAVTAATTSVVKKNGSMTTVQKADVTL